MNRQEMSHPALISPDTKPPQHSGLKALLKILIKQFNMASCTSAKRHHWAVQSVQRENTRIKQKNHSKHLSCPLGGNHLSNKDVSCDCSLSFSSWTRNLRRYELKFQTIFSAARGLTHCWFTCVEMCLCGQIWKHSDSLIIHQAAERLLRADSWHLDGRRTTVNTFFPELRCGPRIINSPVIAFTCCGAIGWKDMISPRTCQ